MRLEDAVTYFLNEWPSEGATYDTVRGYSGQLKWLVGFATKRGKVMLADLTPELLRAGMASKLDPKNHSLRWQGGESCAKALATAARRMARWLRVQGLPVADLSVVKAPHAPERIQPRLRQEEFKAIESTILHRLIDASRRVPRLAIARDLALVYMLADTGLRASEVCAMDVKHVDFTSGSVLVIRGKGKKQRALSIVDPNDRDGGITLRLLSDWIELRQAVTGAERSNRLWISLKGTPLNRESLRRILLRICMDAGIDGNRPPHAFRRSWFTESYKESPGSIRVLAARMGWSDKSHHMIDVYTRGAEVELARTTPVPSISARWSVDSPKVRGFSGRSPLSMIDTDVGSGRSESNAPGLPTVGTRDRTRRASVNSRRGSRP